MFLSCQSKRSEKGQKSNILQWIREQFLEHHNSVGVQIQMQSSWLYNTVLQYILLYNCSVNIIIFSLTSHKV